MSEKKSPQFTSATAPRQGRLKGSRNALSADFLDALQRDFEKHGHIVIQTVRMENPGTYLKVIAMVIPKEYEITDSRLKDLSDDDLETLTEILKRSLAGARRSDGGEKPSLN